MDASSAPEGGQWGDASPSADRLRPSEALLLGMIRGGLSSGYAIRRAVEAMHTDAFWATTFAQIYPDLARLERRGLVTSRDDPHGARQRSAYSITERGTAAFDAWLRTAAQPPMELRDEGLLRLALCDFLAPDERRALVRELRERAEREERRFREEMLPVAEQLRAGGLQAPAIVGRMGAEYHAWAAGYFAGLEAELGA
jgi:DNA-binding PadR family transcriptional regulator